MRIKDEAMFMRKSGGEGYVTDGLVWCIDGRDDFLGGTDTKPILLNRATKAPVIVDTALSWSSNVDGFYKVAYKSMTCNIGLGDNIDGIQTVEFLLNHSENEFPSFFMALCFDSLWGRAIQLNPIGTVVAVQNGAGAAEWRNSPDNCHHVMRFGDAQSFALFKNGVKYNANKAYETPRNPEYSMLRLFSQYGTQQGLYIGSVRCYNRQLTDEEIIQNYEYEKSLGRVE